MRIGYGKTPLTEKKTFIPKPFNQIIFHTVYNGIIGITVNNYVSQGNLIKSNNQIDVEYLNLQPTEIIKEIKGYYTTDVQHLEDWLVSLEITTNLQHKLIRGIDFKGWDDIFTIHPNQGLQSMTVTANTVIGWIDFNFNESIPISKPAEEHKPSSSGTLDNPIDLINLKLDNLSEKIEQSHTLKGCSCSDIQRNLDILSKELRYVQEQDRKHIVNQLGQNRRLISELIENQHVTKLERMYELESKLESISANANRIISRIDELHDNQIAEILAKVGVLLSKQEEVYHKTDLKDIETKIIESQEKLKSAIVKVVNEIPLPKDSTQEIKEFISQAVMPKECCDEIKNLLARKRDEIMDLLTRKSDIQATAEDIEILSKEVSNDTNNILKYLQEKESDRISSIDEIPEKTYRRFEEILQKIYTLNAIPSTT